MTSDKNHTTTPWGKDQHGRALVVHQSPMMESFIRLVVLFMMIFAGEWSLQPLCRAQGVDNIPDTTAVKGGESSEVTGGKNQEGEKQSETPSLTVEQQADFALWKSAMTESTDAVARRRAAGKLLASGWKESLDLLSSLLKMENQPEVVTAIADAVSEASDPPSEMLVSLMGAYERSTDAVRESLEIALTQYPPEVAIPEISTVVHDKKIAVADRVALIALLSRFVEVETVDALIPCLDKDEPAPVREAAGNALAIITGVDIGESRLRWEDWWQRHRIAGREGLLAANIERLQEELKDVRKRDRQYRDERAALIGSLVHWIEQAYALEPKDHRPGMLVALLGDDWQEIRLLGLRLIEQAMSNGEPMPAEVTDAVAGCVDDSSAEVRSGAIRQLIFLDGVRAGALAAKRLDNENDLTVRLALEAALTRYPSKDGEAVLFKRFVDSPGRVGLENDERKAIAGALSAAFRASFVPGMDERNQLAGIILSDVKELNNENILQKIINTLSNEEVGLLAWSVAPEARQVRNIILTGEIAGEAPVPSEELQSRQLAVARELAASGLDDVALYNKAGDSAIHAIAFGVLKSRKGLLNALGEVLGDFPEPDEKTRQADISEIMAALPIKDWVAADDKLAASNDASLDQRAAWLRRVLSVNVAESTGNTTPSESTKTDTNIPNTESTENNNGVVNQDNEGNNPAETEDGMIRRQVCIRLAEVELLLGQPAEALIALKAAPASQTDQDHAQHLRAVAMIASGESGDGLPAGADQDVSVWLEALTVMERMTTKNGENETNRQKQLQTLAMKIRELGEDQLSDKDRARITAILGDKDKEANKNDVSGEENNNATQNNNKDDGNSGGG